MSYLSGIIDKRSLVADDLAASAAWLKEHKVEGMPTVYVILNYDDWEIPEAWDSAHGYKLTGMIGACVAQVWARAPSAPVDVTDEALAKLEFAAACFEFLAAAGDNDRLRVAEAWLEWIYETKIERPRLAKDIGSQKAKISGKKGAEAKINQGEKSASEVKKLWSTPAITKLPERNRASVIAKKVGLTAPQVRTILDGLGLKSIARKKIKKKRGQAWLLSL